MRAALWRLPIVVLLWLATATVAAAAGTGPGHLPRFVPAVSAPVQQAALADPRRGGPDTGTAGFDALAVLSERAAVAPARGWLRPGAGAGRRAQERHETYQERGPPGRRAPDASS